jgi:hypothetical protein
MAAGWFVDQSTGWPVDKECRRQGPDLVATWLHPLALGSRGTAGLLAFSLVDVSARQPACSSPDGAFFWP